MYGWVAIFHQLTYALGIVVFFVLLLKQVWWYFGAANFFFPGGSYLLHKTRKRPTAVNERNGDVTTTVGLQAER